jgi:hypothetical protein
MTNIGIDQTHLDIALSTPNGTNIPASAARALSFQFQKEKLIPKLGNPRIAADCSFCLQPLLLRIDT